MNVANLYRQLKQILNDSNAVLTHRGLGAVNNLYQIPTMIASLGGVNRLQYLCHRDIVTLTEHDLYNVTSLRWLALSDLPRLTNVTIPDSVTETGAQTFQNCTSLKNVILPNSIVSLDTGVFQNCTSLENITIPDSVTSIGEHAFGACTSLTNITIPDSVTSIGNSAFYDCTSLTSISIPDGVTVIGNYTFSYCTSLTSITIPDSVTSIGEQAFFYCSNLTNVTIGNGVTNIGYNAFEYCHIIDIYLHPIIPPALGGMYSIPVTATIHVPIGSGEAYKSATNWSYHSSRIIEDITI